MKGVVLQCCVVLVSISLAIGSYIDGCPDGRRQYRCYVNPCDVAGMRTCIHNTALQCRPNYCRGCDVVEFYDTDSNRVPCTESLDNGHDKKKLD